MKKIILILIAIIVLAMILGDWLTKPVRVEVPETQVEQLPVYDQKGKG